MLAAEALRPAACPATHIRVVRSTGVTTDYLGTIAGIPELCRMDRSDGSGGGYYWGSYRTDWPGAGDAYPAIRTVMLGGKGAQATFTTRSVPGWQWHDTYVNQGTESLTVNGLAYSVVVLAHEREGFEGNTYHSIITSWRDITTGATLKVVENQIAGESYGPGTTWIATQVVPLP